MTYYSLLWSYLIAQLVKKKKIRLQCRRPWFNSWSRRICWRRDKLHTPIFLGFPCGSDAKESARSVGGLESIPGLGRFPGEGKGYHSSVLAWRIPGTIQSMGSQRVGHDWVTCTFFGFFYQEDLNSSHDYVTWLLLVLSFIAINSLIKLFL